MFTVQRIVNSVFSSNTYILTQKGFNWCWIIDIGDILPVTEMIPKGIMLKGILLTHTHYDHIYGINQLVGLYPKCTVYTSEKGKEGLFSDKLNFSRYHDDPVIFKGDNIHLLYESDELELFPGDLLKVAETPGHDWSCLTFYTDDLIFTGDSFIPGMKVITTLPRSNKQEANLSLNKIKNLVIQKDIYPGHGDSTKFNSLMDECFLL